MRSSQITIQAWGVSIESDPFGCHGGRLAALRLYPINVNNFEVVFQPQPLAGAAAGQVVETVRTLSAALKTVIVDDAGTALLRLPLAAAMR